MKQAICERYGIQFAEIPEGVIWLNDDRIKKKWQVSVEPFLLSTLLVTQELYADIVGESPSFFSGKKLPVESITWKEAAVFCNLLSAKAGLNACYQFEPDIGKIEFDKDQDGFRLPLESEWQYACQANTTGIRYGDIDSIAWYKENSEKQTQAVGLKQANDWGLHDMLGNVWEWCSDIYDEQVYESYRIFRGGGWSDEARSVMATTRRRSHPTKFRIEDLGFRIAKNMD